MNKIINKVKKAIGYKLSIWVVISLFVQTSLYAQAVEDSTKATNSDSVVATAEAPKAEGSGDQIALGEKLFKTNCAACHTVGDNKLVGPGLKGINEKRSVEWLLKWVKNSAELIASGDADAKAIFEEYNKVPMPAQTVNDDEIKAILAYIKNPPVKVDAAATEVVGEEKAASNPTTTLIILAIIILVLLGVILLLNKSRVTIAKAAAEKEGVEYNGPVSFVQACKYTIGNNKGLVAAIVIVVFFSSLVKLMDGAFVIGVHTGYKPEQPIKFSHKVHAGDNKIDCNYCHSSARHSKTSGIPSLNVCMNCHKYVDGTSGKTFTYNGEEYSMTDEIKKIYAALDYNPETQVYGSNPTPVKWIKVHNLPDHAYFNHSQHVTVGGQKCQTCHGTVEEMDVVEQFSPLTMKWCIECHNTTGVMSEGNGYYEEMHARMNDKYKEKWLGDGKLTVEEMGGWECAKCHY